MTPGSALPWRACSTLGRIQHRLSPLALRRPRTVRHLDFLRAQSSGNRAANDLPAEQSTPAATDASSSLIDRLSRVPVRRHGTWDSVVVRPITPYPHKREDREGLQKNHRALTQQARLEKYRVQFQAGDWRAILQNLMKWSDTCVKPEDGVKIIIPKQSADLLLSDHEDNLWNIKARTRCAMTLYRPAGEKEGEGEVQGKGDNCSEGDNMDPYIMLSGQPTAITAAVDDILKVSKRVTVVQIQGSTKTVLHGGQAGQLPSTDSAAAPVTPTPILRHPTPVPSRPYTLNMRVDQIPRPSEWTAATFHHHVAALTMARPHASLARKLYPGTESHRGTVVQQLHSVFNDPDAEAAISIPALKLALEYLVRSGETFVTDAQALFDRVNSLGWSMDTDVYNLMAETSVKSKNLLAFECILSDMVLRGHKPNVRTWLLFLRIIEAEEVRRYILHAMHTKDFFSDPRVVNSVSVDMADHDAYRAIQLGQDCNTFLDGLRELYGPEWRLRTRAANRYLDVFGRYSKFDDMTRLLGHMFASEHGRPNVISLNTVITHCKHQNKVDLALGFVRMFDKPGRNVADDVTFHLLFEVARKTRKPHLLSAIWRYAHILEMTNYRMRDRGIKLLAGGDEVLHMTDRIRGLWESPHDCKLSKQEFIDNLLLCDHKISLAKFEKLSPAITAEGGEQSATNALSNDESSNDESSKPARAQTLPVSRTGKYDIYSHWASKKAQRYEPTIPLGEFLQAALDRDRSLHKLAHEGVGRVHEGLPVDIHPLQMHIAPLAARRFELNSMPGWLREKKKTKKHGNAMLPKAKAMGDSRNGGRETPRGESPHDLSQGGSQTQGGQETKQESMF